MSSYYFGFTCCFLNISGTVNTLVVIMNIQSLSTFPNLIVAVPGASEVLGYIWEVLIIGTQVSSPGDAIPFHI